MQTLFKSLLKLLLGLIVLIILTAFSSNEENGLILENELFLKKFSFSENKSDKISVEFQIKNQISKVLNSIDIPIFEFVINNQLVSANDKLWIFRNDSKREMLNGGTEHTLIFEGVKNPVDGLKIILLQQIFPNSTLVREKLILSSNGKTFTLNKLDGKLHFRFPSYTFSAEIEKPVKSTEIRIATWEKNPITFGDPEKGSNHMYYPDVISSEVTEEVNIVKGPISIISNGHISWLTAYEHASQDNLNGLFDTQKMGAGNLINDARN